MVDVLRVAVVGSGPAGMYAVESLLETAGCQLEIDVYERLPSPWGLVRGGVAPDHPEKKLVVDRLFHFYLDRPEVRYFGNVEVGRDVRPPELASWYHAVIYALGAGSDTQLGIPGEDLPGSWSAREFVAWYNGHPDYQHSQFDLSCERAVIIGNGNVALDVARILTMPVDALRRTDIANHALLALESSRINEVVILGRRAHFQGAFNNPELEELGYLESVAIEVERNDFPTESDLVMDDNGWQTRRKLDTLRALAARRVATPRKKIVFRFLSSPAEIIGNDRVEQILVISNHLERGEDGVLKARPTEQENLLKTGLVLRAIGYRGYPLSGLPFDERLGIIPNQRGRVTGDTPGIYVTGWIKRGPQGIIGSNKKCARETVKALLEDFTGAKLAREKIDRATIHSEILSRNPRCIDYRQWLAIDREERRRGRAGLRPREKITQVGAMLDIAMANGGMPGL